VYIRYKRGGKNYRDLFVKMPAGVMPKSNQAQNIMPQTTQTTNATQQNLAPNSAKNSAQNQTPAKNMPKDDFVTYPSQPQNQGQSPSESSEENKQRLEAIHKSQELMRNSIDSSALLE